MPCSSTKLVATTAYRYSIKKIAVFKFYIDIKLKKLPDNSKVPHE